MYLIDSQSSLKQLSCQNYPLSELLTYWRDGAHTASSYRNSRVSVNKVYNDYIANKQHIHMNGILNDYQFIIMSQLYV